MQECKENKESFANRETHKNRISLYRGFFFFFGCVSNIEN